MSRNELSLRELYIALGQRLEQLSLPELLVRVQLRGVVPGHGATCGQVPSRCFPMPTRVRPFQDTPATESRLYTSSLSMARCASEPARLLQATHRFPALRASWHPRGGSH